MNEWQSIAWFLGIASVFFTAVWAIVAESKKSAHARIGRLEHTVDGIIEACAKKQEDFITTKAFDRFENHLNTKFDGMNNSINHLTTRIDDFIRTNRNGKHEQ